MQDGTNFERHDSCPFAGSRPEDVVTRTRIGTGVTVAWASLLVTLLLTMGAVLISIGKLTNTVEVTVGEVQELGEGQKQIVGILANQREIQADIRNLKNDVSDIKARLRDHEVK